MHRMTKYDCGLVKRQVLNQRYQVRFIGDGRYLVRDTRTGEIVGGGEFERKDELSTRTQNISASKRHLRNLVLNNFEYDNTYFHTITYSDESTDSEDRFIKRIRKYFRGIDRYVYCFERGNKGRLHVHAIVFGSVPPSWSYGFTYTDLLDGQVLRIASYIVKYLYKANVNHPDIKRRYYASKGLKRNVDKIDYDYAWLDSDLIQEYKHIRNGYTAYEEQYYKVDDYEKQLTAFIDGKF